MFSLSNAGVHWGVSRFHLDLTGDLIKSTAVLPAAQSYLMAMVTQLCADGLNNSEEFFTDTSTE